MGQLLSVFFKEETRPTYYHEEYRVPEYLTPRSTYYAAPSTAKSVATLHSVSVSKPLNVIKFNEKNQKKLYQYIIQISVYNYKWIFPIPEIHFTELHYNNELYIELSGKLTKSLRTANPVISKICQIENPFLMGQYLLKKQEYQARGIKVQERKLFHGTKQINLMNICKNNFDWRKCGTGTGHRFGRGVSFSPKPSYAAHYCDKGIKVMIVANVLFGSACIGYGNMELPEPGFDSSKKEDGSVIVKYYDDEFYPAYLIYFTANIQKHFKKTTNVQY